MKISEISINKAIQKSRIHLSEISQKKIIEEIPTIDILHKEDPDLFKNIPIIQKQLEQMQKDLLKKNPLLGTVADLDDFVNQLIPIPEEKETQKTKEKTKEGWVFKNLF